MKAEAIRKQVFVAFMVYATLSLLVSVVCFWLFRRQLEVSHVSHHVDAIHYLSLKAAKSGQRFLLQEIRTSSFYQTGGSQSLDAYGQLRDSITLHTDSLGKIHLGAIAHLQPQIGKMRTLLTSYDITLREIIIKTKRRGFADYGLEGRLRAIAHVIENEGHLPLAQLLQLRRYEKDFMLRQDSASLIKFNAYAQPLAARIAPQQQAHPLNDYLQVFAQIAKLDNEIGIATQAGLVQKLLQQEQQLETLAASIGQEVHSTEKAMSEQIENIFLFIITVSVILTLVLAMLFKLFTEKRIA